MPDFDSAISGLSERNQRKWTGGRRNGLRKGKGKGNEGGGPLPNQVDTSFYDNNQHVCLINS